MSKATKAWLITASALTALGLILFAAVMTVCNWDFTKLSTVEYKTEAYNPDGEFDKISVDTDTAEIELVPSEDKECKVVCFESEKAEHYAAVENGTLVIRTIDTRKWYEYIGISLKTPKITVYLPQNSYNSLSVESDTGDITVPKDFAFKTVQINGHTSDVDFFASVSDTVQIKTASGNISVGSLTADSLSLTAATGDIKANSVSVNNGINIKTNTGTVKLTDISCGSFLADSNTGDMSFKNVLATGSLSVESGTGNVRFDNSDADTVCVKTGTGDVTGTLLSEKTFVTKTSTGTVRVPKTASGGKCEITTSTGNIIINIQK